MASKIHKPGIPLYIDLDGTLVTTDIFIESAFALFKKNIFYLFILPFWLIHGKANLKKQIACRVDLKIPLLPFHKDFLDYLNKEKAKGRILILATASNIKFAQQIAEHLGIFNEVIASDDKINLSGESKLNRIRELSGQIPFDYAGNDKIDLKIWRYARRAILVNPTLGVKTKVEKLVSIERLFEHEGNKMKDYLSAMRLHQWSKNILLFIPIVMAHKAGDIHILSKGVIGFLSFSICASGTYLLNDLLDLSSDRSHHSKRLRPFAIGTISIIVGTLLIPCLLVTAFSISLLLSWDFICILAFYCIMTITYSLWLKKVVLIDVFVLAGLYTLRIIAGGRATSVVLSFWLLAFSLFIFFSLAIVKRYTELHNLNGKGVKKILGRGYETGDLETLAIFGCSSGYLAALVLALYINSDRVSGLYSNPEIIWLLCPLLMYWTSRIWLFAKRGCLNEDPVVFAMKDNGSRWVFIISIIIFIAAI